MGIKGRINRFMWWVFVIRLALRWVPKFNLGDAVIYKGERWHLYQGVASPTWGLSQGGGVTCQAREDEFRKVRSIRNYVGSFMSGYRFYMTSWFSIWCREGVKPWMLACNIWSGRPPIIKPQDVVGDV
jgi:hypothetical protein